jgi:23S rRNA (cytidine1920-2'-O)/16S rRNA (cytidine1409-2'-O)-methyltransferase
MSRERADKVLVARGLFDSRAKAQAAIEAGLVFADGVLVKEPSSPIAPDCALEASAPHPWVSRGGVKLDFALNHFCVSPSGRICLDLGASTGGFTDVLLARGALRVFAADVGRGQLHAKLAADPRVVSLEATDSRALTLELIPEAPSLITADLSFIGLAKALGPALALAASDADLILLVKPQFELGAKRLGKGGVIREDGAAAEASQNVAGWLSSQGWIAAGGVESPIRGSDGNREALLHAVRLPAGTGPG